MAMTKERIDEMRRHWLNPDGLHYTTTPNLVAAVTALGECLDEITRLQRIKPAPTREQVIAAVWGAPCCGTRIGGSVPHAVADALSSANLLQEPEREDGHYWCFWNENWYVYQWKNGAWNWRGDKAVWKPEIVGPRIPDPPSTT